MAQEKSRIVTIDESKRWLRRAMIRQRQSIPLAKRKAWSRRIFSHLYRSSYYKRAKTIAAYISFGSEILTDGLVQQAWKDGKKVLIPVTSLGFDKPFFALFQKGDRLKKSMHGPMELVEKSKAFPFTSIDLVIVPGLAFDEGKYRLGYGGGVYDRILKKTPKARHVGLFFSNQYMPVLPRDRHDQKMDAILTEKGV